MNRIFFGLTLILISVNGIAQENLEIAKIKFQGNEQFSASKLKDQIVMETSSWFKQKILKKEPVLYTQKMYDDDINRLQNFYQKEGYLNVRFNKPIIGVNKKNKVELTFVIAENQPITISNVSFTVDSAQTLDEVLSKKERKSVLLQLEATEEKVFRDEDLINDKLMIAEVFFDNGFPYVNIDHKLKPDTVTHTTHIRYNIERGPLSRFGTTTIAGNNRVPESAIKRQLAYDESDIWRKKKIDQTQKQIYNQGIYRVVSIKSQMDVQKSDTIPMRIQIEEAPRWTTRFGVGYGKEDKFRAFTDVWYLNFLTKTGRINLYAKHSGLEPYNLYFRFSQPSFLFPINTFSIYPFLQAEKEPGYSIKKTGFEVSMQQNFSKYLNTSVGYIYENVKADTTQLGDNILEIDPDSYYKKSGIMLGAIYNNGEPILDPVQGYVLSLNFKNNGLGSTEMPFLRILAEYDVYIGIRNDVVLALKFKGGGIKRTDGGTYIPVEERFYGGGSHSVRGWKRSDLGPKDAEGNPVGGNSLFETSTEFRFDIGRMFKFILFADAGNVWEKPFSYRFNDLHYAAGTGLRIKTPIGPAGLDFARPVFDTEKAWQIHFNIGHVF